MAGLLGVASIGAVAGAQAVSVSAFHTASALSAALVALAGVLALIGIRNPRRTVRCEDCPGGQLAGQPVEAARERIAA